MGSFFIKESKYFLSKGQREGTLWVQLIEHQKQISQSLILTMTKVVKFVCVFYGDLKLGCIPVKQNNK